MSSLFGAWAMTLPSFTRRSLSSLENSTSTHSLRYLFVISSRRIRWKLPLSALMILHDQALTDKDTRQSGKRRSFYYLQIRTWSGVRRESGLYRLQSSNSGNHGTKRYPLHV